jgi:hypothetical protein
MAAPGPLRLFADLGNFMIMAAREGRSPLLVAGRRTTMGRLIGMKDGDGTQAQFALPAAVALGPGGVAYVAEAEGDVIRRLRLPGWLIAGSEPPMRRGR